MSEPDSKKTTSKLIITLNKKGNEDVDRVVEDLTQKGFSYLRTLDFGKANILYGTKEGDVTELESVPGVKAVEVEGIRTTSTSNSPTSHD